MARSKILSPRERAFVDSYVELGNATEAYRRAGYKGENADVLGSYMLRKPLVKAEIERRRLLVQQCTDREVIITREEVLREYRRLALCDIRKLYDTAGNIKPIHELDDDAAAMLAGVEEEVSMDLIEDGNGGVQKVPVRVRKVKLCDKKGALDSVARHLGMFEKDSAGSAQQVILNINLGHQQIQTGVKRANPRGESQ